MNTITHIRLKLIKNLFLGFLVLSLSTASSGELKAHFQMKNSYGSLINLQLALTPSEHMRGLSGIRSKDFKESMGMLFINSEVGPRRFWMPDTYFNLDIIFLDENLKIVGIERNVPAHPGMSEPPQIFKTKTYSSQFILETRAGSDFSKRLTINDKLIFTGSTSLSEIVLKTRQRQ